MPGGGGATEKKIEK